MSIPLKLSQKHLQNHVRQQMTNCQIYKIIATLTEGPFHSNGFQKARIPRQANE